MSTLISRPPFSGWFTVTLTNKQISANKNKKNCEKGPKSEFKTRHTNKDTVSRNSQCKGPPWWWITPYTGNLSLQNTFNPYPIELKIQPKKFNTQSVSYWITFVCNTQAKNVKNPINFRFSRSIGLRQDISNWFLIVKKSISDLSFFNFVFNAQVCKWRSFGLGLYLYLPPM